jgi:hypothetical protein
MSVRRLIFSALFAATATMSITPHAQTTAASGTVVVLPLASAIPNAYATTVFVRNPASSPITLNVRYYQSDNATPPGNGSALPCPQLSVPANAALSFDLAVQCNFSPSDNFGMIILEDVTSTYKTNGFFAYSRTENPTGNGFSVEGFPVGNFSSAQADALGLKKTSAAPHYKSNCFVGALNETVGYTIRLFQGETSVPIGSAVSGSLLPYHTTRILDVFAAAGAPLSNYTNVRATFSNSSNSAMIGFCTLETTDNGSADFRIAKSDDARDVRQARLACYGQDDCGSASVNNAATVSDTSKKNIHYMIIDQPDFVKCDLVGDATTMAALEITLRAPGNALTAPVFTLPPPYNVSPYTSGGGGQTGFYVYTGERGTISSGTTTRWYIDVQRRAGSIAVGPFNYGITCLSGNGVSVPWLGTTAAATP